MKTYTKTFNELSNEERNSFLSLSEFDGTIKSLIEGINNDESVDINIAFNTDGTAIDYCVFDPYHHYTDSYTYADGWTNWFFENYDEEDEDDLQLSEEDINELMERSPYPDDDPRSNDEIAWIESGEYNSCFYTEDGKRLYKIKENPDDDSSWIVVYIEDGEVKRY